MASVVDLLKKFVAIDSEVYVEKGTIVRKKYSEIAKVVADEAEKAGLSVERIDLKVDNDVIPTLLISIDTDAEETLALVCHYDVVPAKGPWVIAGREVSPYEPVEIDGKLYGRGAADDKSAIASGIAALAELAEEGAELRYKPVLVVTGDEEVGGVGIRALLDQGYKWDKAVILDSAAEYIGVGASGVIHLWVKVKGKGGHAGYPHLAVNAAEKLVELMHEFMKEYKAVRGFRVSKYPSPPGSPLPKVWGRASLTILKLGEREAVKHNIIPSEAVAGIDIRLVPEESLEQALDELYSVFSSVVSRIGVQAELEIVAGQRGWYSTDEKLVEEAKQALSKAIEKTGVKQEVKVAAELGGNDGTFFFNKGIPVVAYGAIRADNNIHADNEFVYIKDLYLLKEFIKALVVK